MMVNRDMLHEFRIISVNIEGPGFRIPGRPRLYASAFAWVVALAPVIPENQTPNHLQLN
jgi:hypothetical protein